MTSALPIESGRLLRIGEVVRRLRDEFPDISISKIRYLEDEGLLTPRRTQGGYRLFSENDLERLQTILRLQRDEFLPLRVIKEELDAPAARERQRRRPTALGAEEESVGLDELVERAGITTDLAKELEEYGLLAPHGSGADKRYAESDIDVAAACAQLTRYGVAPRNLRTVPHGDGPAGVADRAARRAGVAVAQPRAARAGARGSATARGARRGAVLAPLLARPERLGPVKDTGQ